MTTTRCKNRLLFIFYSFSPSLQGGLRYTSCLRKTAQQGRKLIFRKPPTPARPGLLHLQRTTSPLWAAVHLIFRTTPFALSRTQHDDRPRERSSCLLGPVVPLELMTSVAGVKPDSSPLEARSPTSCGAAPKNSLRLRRAVHWKRLNLVVVKFVKNRSTIFSVSFCLRKRRDEKK